MLKLCIQSQLFVSTWGLPYLATPTVSLHSCRFFHQKEGSHQVHMRLTPYLCCIRFPPLQYADTSDTPVVTDLDGEIPTNESPVLQSPQNTTPTHSNDKDDVVMLQDLSVAGSRKCVCVCVCVYLYKLNLLNHYQLVARTLPGFLAKMLARLRMCVFS